MKKLLFLALSLFMMSTSTFAWKLVPLTIYGDDNTPVGNDFPRGPIELQRLFLKITFHAL